SKNKVKNTCKNQQRNQSTFVLQRIFGNHLQHAFTSDKISQKDIGNQKRNHKKDKPFKQSFSDFFRIPFLFCQLHLGISISVNPAFNSPDNHFHKNGFRTDPATKYTSECNRKKRHKHHSHYHRNQH